MTVADSLVVDTNPPLAAQQRGFDGLNQCGTSERLVEKGNGTSLSGPLPRIVVAVRSQDHRRNTHTRLLEMCQQIEAAHSGHPQVEHEATGACALGGLQERFRRFEHRDAEADRQQQIPDGASNRFVVVHNRDYTFAVLSHAAIAVL